MRAWTCGAALVATLSLGSCDRISEGCTEVGGLSGVRVTLPSDLYREGREAQVEVCQGDRCESATRGDLVELADGVDASVELPGLASTVEEGVAQVEVTLRDGARVVRVLESEVDLSYNYPNGRDCDGDQWLAGEADFS